MKVSSSKLLHHTREFENLISIIENGFEHRTVNESLPFSEHSSSAFNIPGIIRYDFKFDAVCFTDLPPDKIANHIDQYGEYVIGLSKDWGIANGITPIRYIHHYTPDIFDDNFRFIKNFIERYPQSKEDIVMMINNLLEDDGHEDLISDGDISNLPEKFQRLIQGYNQIITDVCAFTYSHFGLMRIYKEKVRNNETGDLEEKIYYNEREWRSLDPNGEKGNLTFTASNISGIYVKTKEEQKTLLNFFRENKSKYKIEDIEKFKTKIKLTDQINANA